MDCTSLSFLSALMCEAAGMDLTPYMHFLQDVESVIPAINMEGYYSVDAGMFQLIDDAASEELEWINRYHQIQYAYLFDEPDPSFYGVEP